MGRLHLTPHQRAVVDLRLRRMGRREIARRLGVSPRTVKYHLDQARAGNDVPDEVELLLAAVREPRVMSA